MSRLEAHAATGRRHVAESQGIRVERHRRPSVLISTRYGGDAFATIIVSLSNAQRVERLVEGRSQISVAYRGTATIVDPDYDTRFLIDGETDIVKFFLPASDLYEHCGGAVPMLMTEPHRELERLAYRVVNVLDRGEGADEFVLADLVSRIGPSVAPRYVHESFRGGLAPAVLRRVLELIEHGLEQPRAVSPSVRAMAAEAGLSPYHFAREFLRSAGMTPHQFALRRRLERARDHLVGTDESIHALSERYGFASPSHFVQRFRAELGLPPAKLRALIADSSRRAHLERSDARRALRACK